MSIKAACAAMLLLPSAAPAQQAPAEDEPRFTVPDSVSPEARAILAPALAAQRQARPQRVNLGTDLLSIRAMAEQGAAERMAAVADRYRVVATPATLDGVPVLRVVPRDAARGKRLLIYVHGGGWATGSARSSFRTAAIFADATKLEVVSVDYGLAPEQDFRGVTGQVAAVYRALLAAGHDASRIGLFGDSAGGNIILGTTLRLRDEGQPLPAALVGLSPCTDLGAEGDTRRTLADADPVLDVPETLEAMRLAYAGEDAAAGMLHPWASPVRGDYRKPFPPTLIQGGTRELLLSDFVRQYQVMRGAGREAMLDLYEGMPHVFMSYLADTPEGRQAIATARDFLLARLAAD
ncbi:alpha/beta hydrolase [Sphingopyxis sp. PET50]|uniref:alpha/beta hydrolase n=1 Tax=Sphingopyxis sp. PET50 TaxID=2976533 RepID=UPI0021AFF8CF|nr:alpha/beta hydrolase [Sphingopyxis sp. PET50]